MNDLTNNSAVFAETLSDLILPLSHNVVGGIGVGVTSSVDGLLLLCEPYTHMREADIIDIYLYEPGGGNAPIFRHILSAEEVNENVIIIVPPEKIRAGWFEIYYTVTHSDSGILDRSDVTHLWIKLDVPGGYDPAPHTPNINERLKIPVLPASIIYNGVSTTEAKKGVPVTISAYENMRVRDRINLSWGGVITSHSVTESEVNNSIIIKVDEATILRAGDSDHLLVYYEIRDEVNNSSKFSPDQAISVDVAGNRLSAPVIKEAVNNSIDLNKLNKGSVTVQVWASPADFSLNDSVWLQLSGRNSAGDEVYREAYLTVTALPSTIEFAIAWEDVAAFAEGYFIASYTLIKSSDDSRIPSRKISVTVKGTLPSQLPAPEVAEAVANNLDGSLDLATVIIPAFSAMVPGAEILLFWRGVTAGGDSYNHIETVNIVAANTPVSVIINKSAIQILSGGTVNVYYQFTSADGVATISDKTIFNVIQSLPAPVISNTVDDVLNPNDIITGVTVTVPPWPSMAGGDRIDLHWKAVSDDGTVSDWLKISAIAVGKPVKFIVSKADVEKSINSTVDVWYQVTQGSGLTLTSVSVLLRIRHATQINLAKVIVDKAQDGVLNISDLAEDVVVSVPAYADMQNGDTVTLYLDGEVSWQDERHVTAGMVGSNVLFTIPLATVSANNGKKITLYYKIQSVAAGNGTSPDLVLSVASSVTLLPAPKVDEASNGILYPETLVRNAKLRITPYADMEPGDTVTAFLTGAVEWQDYWPVSGASVNKDIILFIPKESIAGNINSTVYLNYQVKRANGILSSSERLSLQVKAAGLILPAPRVQGAVGGVLDYMQLQAGGATVTVPAWDGMAAGDGVTLFWGPVWTQYISVSGNLAGSDITFVVPLDEIAPLVDTTVTVSYQVRQWNNIVDRSELLTLKILGDSLPLPYVRQATEGVIHTGMVTDGADVVVPQAARLQAGDSVQVIWKSTLSSEEKLYTKIIQASDVGIDNLVVIPTQTVLASAGGEVTLYYVIKRNGRSYESPAIQYSVTRDIVDGNIIVLGARACSGNYRSLAKSRYLVALNRDSGWLTPLVWQYEGDSNTVTATRFLDTHPWKKITVSSASEKATILPLNIMGNGDDDADEMQAAMAARLNDGKVVAWGSMTHGDNLPPALASLDNIQEISGTSGAFAARLKNNSVVAWGDAARGGSVSSAAAKLTNVISLSSASRAFAAILSTGKVVAWGDSSSGGTVPANIASFNNIVKVVGSGGAFVALRANHRLAAWGKAEAGGLLPVAVANLTNVKDIACNFESYVALTHANTLFGWGNSAGGGKLPDAIKALTNVSDIMASNSRAFVVKLANGLLAAWGLDTHGGTLPDDLSYITDVVEVVATWSAFIALRSDGTIISWGNKDAGGVLPREVALLTDIVQIATTASACAALRANGKVVAWGALSFGGNTAPVANKLVNCRALYSSTGAFAALTADDRVVVWGDDRCGADNAAVADEINGLIAYQER